jgi:hypothetical protein
VSDTLARRNSLKAANPTWVWFGFYFYYFAGRKRGLS